MPRFARLVSFSCTRGSPRVPFVAPAALAALVALATFVAPASAQVTGAAVPAAPDPDAPRLPAPTPGGEPTFAKVTFDEAVARALARNPTAREADEDIRRAHALMEQVRAASLPTLNGIGTYTRLDNDRASFPGGPIVAYKGSLYLDATLNVPLIHPQKWLLWSEAKDQVDVSRANAAEARRTLAIAAARAYIAIITQKELVETARTARDNADAHYQFTRAQRVGGIGNRLDETRAAQELTSEEVNLQNEKLALYRSREALGVLVASDDAVDNADESTPTEMPTLGDALNDSEKVRADVQARERATKAARRTVDNAWADYMPYLDLVAEPFYQTPSSTPPSTTFPQTGWLAQLILTVPIYDGGLRYGQEHERSALANEASLDLEATLRQAKSDVRTSFEEIKLTDISLGQAQQAAAFAKHALYLANIAYRAGATTNLEVVDAERQARDAETQVAIAEDAARQARLDLLAASGHFPR